MADDLLKATRVLAMHAVEKKPPEYVYRFIMRWYSREFHTRLDEVEDVPVEDVLQHYFECRYEDMADEDRQEEREDLLMTPEQRAAKDREERVAQADDDDFFRKIQEEARAAAAKVRPATSLEKPPQSDDAPIIPVSVMGQSLPTTFQEIADGASPRLKEIPPEIDMKFVDPGELGDLDEWDIMGAPRRGEKK